MIDGYNDEAIHTLFGHYGQFFYLLPSYQREHNHRKGFGHLADRVRDIERLLSSVIMRHKSSYTPRLDQLWDLKFFRNDNGLWQKGRVVSQAIAQPPGNVHLYISSFPDIEGTVGDGVTIFIQFR